MATVNQEPRGLGGWLILPAISLFVTPIVSAVSFYNDYLPIFREGYWEVLTTPGSEAYHHLWAPFITFDIVGITLLTFFDIILIFLFFAKSYRFPTLMITFLALNLLFQVGDFLFTNLIPALAAEGNKQYPKIIMVIIWIRYFQISKRVKNTFVKPESNKPLQPTAESGG